MSKRLRLGLVLVGVLALLLCAAGSWWGWRQYQATPAYQFHAARQRWDLRAPRHYRLAANFSTNFAQCLYDIAVRDGQIRHVYSVTCLSAESTHTLTVDGIFSHFDRYVDERVCAATGCYCDGTYVLRAAYDPEYGYPTRITTRFVRNWLDDLVNGQYGRQTCRRADVTVERIEIVKFEPLP